MIVGKPKSGVVTNSPGAGEESEDGVDASSVPSRSGVGFEAGLKSPHPIRNSNVMVIHKSLFFFVIVSVIQHKIRRV